MQISKYVIDFAVFSLLGWIYECIYCTCVTKHWQNRGFLFGPFCPIYGSGAAAVMILSDRFPMFAADSTTPDWQLFLIFAIGSAILEFLTSWILEKRFHARWWDYSNMPLNLNGRICLPASVLFGLMGIVILRWAIPLIHSISPAVHPSLDELGALVIAAYFGADTALSAASMTQLLKHLEWVENSVNTRMENGVMLARQIPEKVSVMPAAIKENAVEAGSIARQKLSSVADKLLVSPYERVGMMAEQFTAKELHHLRNVALWNREEDSRLVTFFKTRILKRNKDNGEKDNEEEGRI